MFSCDQMPKRVTVGPYRFEVSNLRFNAFALCCTVTCAGIFLWIVRVLYLMVGGSNVSGLHGHLPTMTEIASRFKRQFQQMEKERDRISKRLEANSQRYGAEIRMPKMQGKGGGSPMTFFGQ